MMDGPRQIPEVHHKFSEEEANEKAKRHFSEDPFFGSESPVSPSLLSATDIVRYVEATAMITPFHATARTLKHASYESKIGENAYIYEDKGGPKRIHLTDGKFLKIPANEIVFIDTEVTFRLPRYIAARFNLTIKHVHRGLLLGTGPLVDPGFKGKLLIPLHNLTSEPYYLSKDDGFIWIEFTRTTFDQSRQEIYGAFPADKIDLDGKKWLHKAAHCAFTDKEVVIRSSIISSISRVEKRSSKAIKIAKRLRNFGLIGAITFVLTFGLIMLGEIYSNRNFMQSAYNAFNSTESPMDQGLIEYFSRTATGVASDLASARSGWERDIAIIRERLAALEAENADLRELLAQREKALPRPQSSGN